MFLKVQSKNANIILAIAILRRVKKKEKFKSRSTASQRLSAYAPWLQLHRHNPRTGNDHLHSKGSSDGRGRKLKRTDRQTEGRYQVNYLTCVAVDKILFNGESKSRTSTNTQPRWKPNDCWKVTWSFVITVEQEIFEIILHIKICCSTVMNGPKQKGCLAKVYSRVSLWNKILQVNLLLSTRVDPWPE